MAKASPKQKPMKSKKSGIKNNKIIEANNLILKKYK
jgi:hypothetical protein